MGEKLSNSPVPSPLLGVDTIVESESRENILLVFNLEDYENRKADLKKTFSYVLSSALDEPESNLFSPYEHGIKKHGDEFFANALYLLRDINADKYDLSYTNTVVPVDVVDHSKGERGVLLKRIKIVGQNRNFTEKYMSRSYVAYLALSSCRDFKKFLAEYEFLARDLPTSLLAFKYAGLSWEEVFAEDSCGDYIRKQSNGTSLSSLSEVYDSLPMLAGSKGSGNFSPYNEESLVEAQNCLLSQFPSSFTDDHVRVQFHQRPTAVFENYYASWLFEEGCLLKSKDYERFVRKLRSGLGSYCIPKIVTIFPDLKVNIESLSNGSVSFSPNPGVNGNTVKSGV